MGRTVLWLGGMSGVGKTTAARTVARRHDLWLYSVDARTYKHAEAMRVPALTMTMDELWLGRSPERMAADFLAEARERFPLIRAEIDAIPDDGAPVLAEGPQLLPGLVPEPALFVIAAPELQRELLSRRGSLTFSATSDPEQAFANRVRRDELLADGLRPHAQEVEFAGRTEDLVDAFVHRHASDWIGTKDRGDVSARRRFENDALVDQWRRYGEYEPRAREGTIDFACECGRPGCDEPVPVTLDRIGSRPFLAHP
jgi:hypothetical protein